jgi:hypothetical protein
MDYKAVFLLLVEDVDRLIIIAIERKFMKVVHVVFEILSRLNMKLSFVFCSFLCKSLNVLLSLILIEIP